MVPKWYLSYIFKITKNQTSNNKSSIKAYKISKKKKVKKSKIIVDILTNVSIIIIVRTLRDTKNKKYPLRYLQNLNFNLIILLITINKS